MPRNLAAPIKRRAVALARWVSTRRIRRRIYVLALVFGVTVFSADQYVESRGDDGVFESVEELPYRAVAVVLGTTPYVEDRSHKNRFYAARIEAAADLYHRGKVSHLIVSGANPSRYYNEPIVMKADLVSLGVPEQKITEDFAGFRTLDSVVRANKIFGQQTFTVVSQRFHLLRAVFLARHYGLNVVGYSAETPGSLIGQVARFREFGARTKALLDVWVLDTQPKFLGDQVAIDLSPRTQGPRRPHTD